MKVIKPYFSFIDEEMGDKIDGEKIFKRIEYLGRNCYKSEAKITNDSAWVFVEKGIKKKHEGLFEHIFISVRIICDRGVSHEIVRHRLVSYLQESTRYCNYLDENVGERINMELIEKILDEGLIINDEIVKEDEGIVFIEPFFFRKKGRDLFYRIWKFAMKTCEFAYNSLIKLGAKPQEARSVLPNSLKTDIIMTCNLRQWHYFLNLRTKKDCHPQVREITIPLLKRFQELIPLIFDDIIPDNLKF